MSIHPSPIAQCALVRIVPASIPPGATVEGVCIERTTTNGVALESIELHAHRGVSDTLRAAADFLDLSLAAREATEAGEAAQ